MTEGKMTPEQYEAIFGESPIARARLSEEAEREIRAGLATKPLPSPTVKVLMSEIDALREEHFNEVTALRLALRDLLDVNGEPCRLDHEGYCQAHYLSKPCIVAAAKALLEATP